MKPCIKHLFILLTMVGGLGLIPADLVTAQTFTVLYSFNGGSDGTFPYGKLVLAGNTLYGTTYLGANPNYAGDVFALTTDGTSFETLYSFSSLNSHKANSDGAYPYAGLALLDNRLYGTTQGGGIYGQGTVFAVNTDGAGFTAIYTFTALDFVTGTNADGAAPYGGLVLSGSVLYGTTQQGGYSGKGTVFAVNTDGTGFVTLHLFTGGNDGANPLGDLILSGTTLYGTTSGGDGSGSGTVFALNTNGSGFTTLHAFTAVDPATGTNSDGASPYAGLVLSGTTLYGTAEAGGTSGNGAIFALNADGTGSRTLYNFTGASDGASPYAALTLSGNTLYGTTEEGGDAGRGTLYAINTDGSGFKVLHGFTGHEGAFPQAGLILSDSTLYGTAVLGGSSNNGTVFSLTLPSASHPPLTIFPSGTNVIVTWPTNYTGFSLQSTTNLSLTAAWTAFAPDPVIVNGQNTVTNPLSATRQFFRLAQ